MYVPPLFMEMLSGSFDISLPVAKTFVPCGTNRTVGFYLGDGIYPSCPSFVKPIRRGHRTNSSRLVWTQAPDAAWP